MKKSASTVLVIVIIAVSFILFLSFSTFVTLHPGEKGIIFRPWSSGLDKNKVYDAGIHIVAPWNTLYVYDVKEQTVEFGKTDVEYQALDVLDKNGLSIEAEITIRFYPIFDKIGYVHENFGIGYIKKLVIPEVRSSVRKVMGRYSAEEIYSTKRKEVEDAIIHETTEVLGNNNIKLTALLIRSIILPQDIKQAIEKKLKQEQEALAYQFLLEREKSEAERKRIEAEGIANYNRILSASLTDKILSQKGIDATIELSKSPNAKVIVVGSSKDGLPLILGNN